MKDIAAVDDRTLTQLLGHIQCIADRRFPAIGAGGLVAATSWCDRFEAVVGLGARCGITTRNRPICQQEGTNEQPGS